MCGWLVPDLSLFDMERKRSQGEMGKIIKPGILSPASQGSRSLLIGQKHLEAESIYFFKVMQTQAI